MRYNIKVNRTFWAIGSLAIITLFITLAVTSGNSKPKASTSINTKPTASTKPTIKKKTVARVETIEKTPSQKPVVSQKPAVTSKKNPKSEPKQVAHKKFDNTIPIIQSNLLPTAGVEFDPGYYYNSKGECDVGVYDNKGNGIYSVMTRVSEQSIYYFKVGERVQNFCVLNKGTPPMVQGVSVISGMHLIGVDIKPGTYTASSTCHFWVGSNNDIMSYVRQATDGRADLNSISAGGNFTIPNNDGVILFHSECQNITRIN